MVGEAKKIYNFFLSILDILFSINFKREMNKKWDLGFLHMAFP